MTQTPIDGVCVERVSSFKFLGVRVSKGLTWPTNTAAVVGKAQQRLFFLRLLRKCQVGTKLLQTFYHSAVESVLVYGIMGWYANSTAKDRKTLQGVITVRRQEKSSAAPCPPWRTLPPPGG